MTRIYLASPRTQQQAEHAEGMSVLLSYATWSPWMTRYQASFGRILIDSGAYSEMNSGKKIDLDAYAAWAEQWGDHADAIAGIDNIRGDWRASMKNYEAFPGGFPTFHDSDPPELLDELIGMAQERNQWIGIGLVPPREGKWDWIRESVERIPRTIHVHGWACRAYSRIRRFDSMDSTNWWRDGMMLRTKLPWLTYGECLGLVIKRYQRENRALEVEDEQVSLIERWS